VSSELCHESTTDFAEEDTGASMGHGLAELWLITFRRKHSLLVFPSLLWDSSTDIQVFEISTNSKKHRKYATKSQIKILALVPGTV